MESIIIEATNNTPGIKFYPDGNLNLGGRAIPEDVIKIFDPIIDFVKKLNDVDVTFNVNFEYLNTAASKKLMELLKSIESNTGIGKVLINWYYEEDDEDSLETAEIMAENLFRSEFKYHEYVENSRPWHDNIR